MRGEGWGGGAVGRGVCVVCVGRGGGECVGRGGGECVGRGGGECVGRGGGECVGRGGGECVGRGGGECVGRGVGGGEWTLGPCRASWRRGSKCEG